MHTTSIPTTAQPGNTDPIIDWLTSQPAASSHEEIQALLTNLQALYEPQINNAQFHRCIELFYSRTLRVTADFRKELRELHLPASQQTAETVHNLSDVLGLVANGFLRVLKEAKQGTLRAQRRLLETASARGLRMLGEQYALGSQLASTPPDGMWLAAHQLFSLARTESEATEQPQSSPAESALFAYKRLLAMATVDPYSLSSAEFDWAAEFLAHNSSLLHLQTERPSTSEGAWYWVAQTEDAEPCSSIRQEPKETANLFFSTAQLAKRAADLLTRFDSGRVVQELDANPAYPGVQPSALLSRLRQRWSLPTRREQPRRKHEYTVQICAGLSAIWHTLSGRANDENGMTEWQVINESPGGFSVMHIDGVVAGLSAGMALALRREEKDPWSICIVRWLRLENPQQLELGLQTVSNGAIPITVGFRTNNNRPGAMTNALVLPVLPALRHHQAILAPTGTYTSRRFCLVSDVDRVYIAQGRLLSLDMQTANIELFQFEIDPYPM